MPLSITAKALVSDPFTSDTTIEPMKRNKKKNKIVILLRDDMDCIRDRANYFVKGEVNQEKVDKIIKRYISELSDECQQNVIKIAYEDAWMYPMAWLVTCDNFCGQLITFKQY